MGSSTPHNRSSATLLARVFCSVVGWTFLGASSLVLFPIALAIRIVTAPFDRNLLVLHLFTCGWGALYLWAHPGWRVRIEGRQRLPWSGPAVLVANHQSMIDPLVIFAMFRPFKIISKAVLQWIPLIGWNIWLNRYVLLSQGKRTSIVQMIETCRFWLRRGMPVMIFPEGTRSDDGQIGEFQRGAMTLAVEENCPVYPIVILGTAGALQPGSALLSPGALIHARVLEPIFPDQLRLDESEVQPRARIAALRDLVRQTMIQELEKLRAETSQRPKHTEPRTRSKGLKVGGMRRRPEDQTLRR